MSDSVKPLCFVIGPIGDKGTEPHRDAEFLLEMVIRPALEGVYQVKRADEDADPGMISNAMIHDITSADLVVADLTSLNPNALYELGIRHSKEMPVIHVATVGTKLPFDTLGHRTIFFDLRDHRSIADTKVVLTAAAARTREPNYEVSNPITQANASFKMRESADPVARMIVDLQSRVETLESEVRRTGYDQTLNSLIKYFNNATAPVRSPPEDAVVETIAEGIGSTRRRGTPQF